MKWPCPLTHATFIVSLMSLVSLRSLGVCVCVCVCVPHTYICISVVFRVFRCVCVCVCHIHTFASPEAQAQQASACIYQSHVRASAGCAEGVPGQPEANCHQARGM